MQQQLSQLLVSQQLLKVNQTVLELANNHKPFLTLTLRAILAHGMNKLSFHTISKEVAQKQKLFTLLTKMEQLELTTAVLEIKN